MARCTCGSPVAPSPTWSCDNRPRRWESGLCLSVAFDWRVADACPPYPNGVCGPPVPLVRLWWEGSPLGSSVVPSADAPRGGQVVLAGLQSPAVGQPAADGVAALLRAAGLTCAYASCGENNFGGRPAPAMTHWTGTTVDFAYVAGAWAVRGAYVRGSALSDHLPVVVDLMPTSE